MKKTAFLTTIFPMEESFLYHFFDSLKEQTYKQFDIIVVNDNYINFDKITSFYKNKLNIIELKYSDTPAKNREYGINYCIDNNYDILIFGDSDDSFLNNRIEKSIELLEENDIIVNDLSLFDINGIYEEKYISNRIKNDSIIDFEFIKNKNIFGLSNTAILLKDMKNIIIPDDLIAVDWYIFTLFLLDNKKAIFTNETVSFYRQYNDNTVGMKNIDLESFTRGINVKKIHYKNLNLLTNKFNEELERINILKLEIKDKKIENPLWWELI